MPRISHLFHFVMCFLRPKVFMCIQSGRDSTPTIGDFGLWHYIVDGQDWPFLNRLFVFLMLFSGKSDKTSIFPTESIGFSGIFCSLKPIHGLLSCWLTHVHTIPERGPEDHLFGWGFTFMASSSSYGRLSEKSPCKAI